MQHTCTTFLAGKKATIDGSTIICREEDYGNSFDPQRFVLIKPEGQPREYRSKNTNFKLKLPIPKLKYTSTPDASDKEGVFGAGGINSANVAMTATETITTNALVLSYDPFNNESGIGEEDFVTLVLPYIKSAKEGVKRLGELLSKYGTYEANAIAFSDKNEVWYMETIGGHHWAAIRIPDDAYVIAPNRFNITNFDFDSPNTISSFGLKEWIDNNDLNADQSGYNLRHICGSETITDTVYNNPRAWYVQQQLGTPNINPQSNDLPFICYSKKKISVPMVKKLMSSHYQGTNYDPYSLKQGEAPFRSIALNRNLELHILQIRGNLPTNIAGVHWLAFGPNTFNAVVPFYANVDDTPDAYRNTSTDYSIDDMYWLTHTITAIGDHNYRQAQSLEENFELQVMSKTLSLQHQADVKSEGRQDISAYLTTVNDQMAEIAMNESKKLLGDLVKLAFTNEKLQF
ncbi:C69 family dipeptidase [Limosilactobacillus sp. STM2_1]|uniref:Dipeptidase n=1 Tax=Limosilactobacillus rudii TaxID=2759755 RepID=A0A7W3UKK5_9LACO|nr:C69 family dipeptidase [Limosilactobacillus rudii]MBB1078521.1 C69 family dipeptidase [Limosilactobacillus rudii]MBB1096650.1 C69 family dipeptidase [Limosilactobacillus rudii]MCD7133683.1 C69 family dipeptidase [Limosilactobacillus rudii]